MPTISFSDVFLTNSMSRLMSYGVYSDNSNAQGLMSRGNNSWGVTVPYSRACLMSIYQGAVPTDINTLTSNNSRSTDELVRWSILPAGANNFGSSSPNSNPAIIISDFVAAIRTGTATWFWWRTVPTKQINSSNTDISGSGIYEGLIGTVGTLGSGNDIEIASTSVTNGQLFRLINLRMQLATSYTY